MADKDLGLTNIYKPSPPTPTAVDEDYASKQMDARMQRLLLNPDLNPSPEPPPEDIPGRGKSPGAGSVVAPPGEDPNQSPALAVVQTAGEQVKQGIKTLQEAVQKLPHDPMQATHMALVGGLLPTLASPLTALFAGVGQGLQNLAPETASHELFDQTTGLWLRTMLANKTLYQLTPEEKIAFNRPMSVREAVEALGPVAIMQGPRAVRGAKTAVAGAKTAGHVVAEEFRQAPERGSIGPRPEPSQFQGAPRPAEAPPAAGGVPTPPAGAEARINLDRIEGTESLKATISDLNKFAGERLEQHRARKSHDKVLAEAAKTRWTVEQMLSHEPEEILVDEPHAFKLRETARAAAEQYESLGKKAEAGDAEALAKLEQIEPIAIKLSALDEAQGSNLARGLEMRKEMATGALAARVGTDSLLAMSRKMSESEPDPLMRFRRFQALRKDQQRGYMAAAYNVLRFMRDSSHLAWLQSLLSNPKTHMANLGATSLVIAGDIPETMMAGWINAAFFRNPEGVQLLEATVKLQALVEAQATGFRLMARAWETGEQPWGRTPMSEHPRISSETYGFDPESKFGRFVDATGATLTAKGMPTRGLMAEDAYMKGVAYDLEIKALAYREALARGKTGKALAREIADLRARPTPDMIQEAQDRGTLLTLNKELGMAGRAFIASMNAIPFGRVLFPFLQTPGNSGKYVFQRLPLLGALSAQNWRDIAAGGALRDRALARMAMGHAMGMVIAYEVSQGHITGGGSVDKNLAALQRDPATSTKPPYSVCPDWSDSCYGVSRMDPAGAYLGAVGDYVELASKIPDQNALDEWFAYGEVLIIAGGKVSMNKNYLQGLSNVVDAIKDPNTTGGKLIGSYARTIVPAGVREFTRGTDDNLVREINSISDAIKSGLPWAASEVPIHRNWVTGEPIHVPPGWAPWPVAFLGAISPVSVTKKNTNPVFQEIQRNEVSLPEPSHYIGKKPAEGVQLKPEEVGVSVKLTGQEYDALITFQTETVKFNGRNLMQALEHLVASDKYKNASVGKNMGRSILMRAEYDRYKQRAEDMLENPRTGSPNLRRDIRQKAEAAYNAQHRPVTSPKSPQYGIPVESIGR